MDTAPQQGMGTRTMDTVAKTTQKTRMQTSPMAQQQGETHSTLTTAMDHLGSGEETKVMRITVRVGITRVQRTVRQQPPAAKWQDVQHPTPHPVVEQHPTPPPEAAQHHMAHPEGVQVATESPPLLSSDYVLIIHCQYPAAHIDIGFCATKAWHLHTRT